MLHLSNVPVLPVPEGTTPRAILTPRVRAARLHDWPYWRALLLSAGLSLTGLSACLPTTLVLALNGRKRAPGDILGGVAIERGDPALIRSLVVGPDGPGPHYETLLLQCALHLADTLGAQEAILVVETTAQLPAQHQGLVLWDSLRKRRPDSALVRELSSFDSRALAVRLPTPKVAPWCPIR